MATMFASLRDKLSRALTRTTDCAILVLGTQNNSESLGTALINADDDAERSASPTFSLASVFDPFSPEALTLPVDERFQFVILKLSNLLATLEPNTVLSDTIIHKLVNIRAELAHIHLTNRAEFARKNALIEATEAMQQLVARLRREREDELKEEIRKAKEALRDERMENGQLQQRIYERDNTIKRLGWEDTTLQATIKRLTATIEKMREEEAKRKVLEARRA